MYSLSRRLSPWLVIKGLGFGASLLNRNDKATGNNSIATAVTIAILGVLTRIMEMLEPS